MMSLDPVKVAEAIDDDDWPRLRAGVRFYGGGCTRFVVACVEAGLDETRIDKLCEKLASPADLVDMDKVRNAQAIAAPDPERRKPGWPSDSRFGDQPPPDSDGDDVKSE